MPQTTITTPMAFDWANIEKALDDADPNDLQALVDTTTKAAATLANNGYDSELGPAFILRYFAVITSTIAHRRGLNLT